MNGNDQFKLVAHAVLVGDSTAGATNPLEK